MKECASLAIRNTVSISGLRRRFMSAGAAAALIGLLFVAISIAPEHTILEDAPIERQGVASSTFTALVNAFFISVAALIPGANLGYTTLIMSLKAT